MRILHFSDVHVPPRLRWIPPADWPSKRLVGALNLALLRGRHFPGVRQKLARLADFAREQEVDLALATGDFTILGTRRELAEARSLVQPFTELPGGLVVVPGNHDRYAPDTVWQERFEEAFGDLLISEPAKKATWPLVRFPGPEVAVVAVDSAVAHWHPLHAWGWVPASQLQRLEALLEDPAVVQRFIFLLVHHAPRLANGKPDRRSHGLHNADRLLAACSRIRRGALLFGHVHRCYRVACPGLAAPLFGAGSATMLGREGAWVFDLDDDRVTATRVRYHLDRYALDPAQRHHW